MATYAFTDLHGNYELWKQIRDYCKEDDVLIFLGDAMDRGDRGWEIFKELLLDPRVIYIRGNHEDMAYNALRQPKPTAAKFMQAWIKNGGQPTIINKDLLNDIDESKYIDMIETLPYWVEYKNEYGYKIILSHAGFTPSEDFFLLDDNSLGSLLLWDRAHIDDIWPREEKEYRDMIIVHGHTPVQCFYQFSKKFDYSNEPLQYADKHKICLDLASAFSNRIVLLDLDTFRTIEFQTPIEKEIKENE